MPAGGAAASASSVIAIPKGPTHSLINYEKFKDIGNSSDDEDEAPMPFFPDGPDGVSPHCCCAKCRAAQGLPIEEDEALEVTHSTGHSTKHSDPGQANKSAASSFSFSRALGDAAKAKIAEGKAGHANPKLPDRSSGSTNNGQRDAAYVNLERLCGLQNKYISAYLDRKGHKLLIPSVLKMLDEYRGFCLGGRGHDESPDEAILRIFVDLQIPIDITDAPNLPLTLPGHMQATQPTPKAAVAAVGVNSSTKAPAKHGKAGTPLRESSTTNLSKGQPKVAKASAEPQHVTSDDSDQSSSAYEESDVDDDLPDDLPECKPVLIC